MTPHDELRALVQRYARAADDREIDALARLFAPDAVIDGARGAQTLEEWLDAMRAPRTFPASMHFIGEPLIELDDEGVTGTLDTYAVVYQLGGEGQRDLTLGIRYLDAVVWHGDRWVIGHRRSTTLWMR